MDDMNVDGLILLGTISAGMLAGVIWIGLEMRRSARRLEQTHKSHSTKMDELRAEMDEFRNALNALQAQVSDSRPAAPQAERSHIRLVREFARDLPTVDVDPNLIRQALLNLLVNAQQALPTGGEIRIRTLENGQFVKLAVADNGPGIPSEHREKIFNLYFSTKPGGTGLGLPMVKKIVEEHHGRIEVDTELKKGTTFTICLKKSGS
jgi:signal transduction histidine kinase